jgi:hypothetical protein
MAKTNNQNPKLRILAYTPVKHRRKILCLYFLDENLRFSD